MDADLRDALRVLAWSAAFGTALLMGAREPGFSRARLGRLIAGLGLGAAAARVGFACMHATIQTAWDQILRDPLHGYSALFVPLGVLAAAPWSGGRSQVASHLGAALTPLPLALGVAKLGCLASGCCHGVGLRSLPTAEIGGLCGVAAALGCVGVKQRPGLALAGLGLVRLVAEPFRAPQLPGPSQLPPAWIAATWVLIGLLLLLPPAVPVRDES